MAEGYAQFAALGTSAVVGVADEDRLDGARLSVGRTVAEFDLACSRFRSDSELSAVNRAAGSAVRVGPLLLEAVAAAVRAAAITDGDVDPTVGEALIALGYDRDLAEVRAASATRAISIASVPGWRAVQVDPEAATIRVPRGVKLDLGATAKALAADRAAERAYATTGTGVLISLGGDIGFAGPAPAGGWRIRVTDDHRSDLTAPGQWISLRSGGLATSSTTTRSWQTLDGTAHHLVDPATGRSASSVWRTVSVTAGSCLDANVASTAAIIRGERAVAWLESLALPSRLVDVDGVVRHLAGWPSEGDDLG